MIQTQIKIEGQLAQCPGCGKQPRAYHVLGKNLYLLECYPCGLRTAKQPTMQQAVEQWEAQESMRAVRA